MRAIRALALGGIAAAALALAAPAAATESVSPFARDFGSVTVGATSSPARFIVTALCEDDPSELFYQCVNPGGDPPLPVEVSVSPGFTQTNDCPPSLPRSADMNGDPVTTTCTIYVSFAPGSAGALSGQLRTGSSAESPAAAIAGTGVNPAAASKQTKCKRRKNKQNTKKKCGKKK